MHLLKKIFVALAVCGVSIGVSIGMAIGAQASPAEPKNGVEYLTLATPQDTDAGKAIEVTEFFAYYCPHCNVLEPALAAWVRQQGANIVFKRVHVPYDKKTLPQQRLFFTLEAMGLVEQYHAKVFHAMHAERLRLNSDEAVFDFVEKQGIERKKFIDAYHSFGIDAKLRRASAMMEAYKIDSWPTVAIDGRFLTSPSQANQGTNEARNEQQLDAGALRVMDFLLAKAKAEKK